MADSEAVRNKWNERHAAQTDEFRDPDEFFVHAYEEFVAPAYPNGGAALDFAGGPGRHALYLAERKWQVTLVDISEVAIQQAHSRAADRGLQIDGAVAECTEFDLGRERFDLIVVFYYLDRDLFPPLFAALKPGGFLIYKTFTVEQRQLPGGPTKTEQLLKPNELLWAFGQMHVVHYRETIAEERATAELVARRNQ